MKILFEQLLFTTYKYFRLKLQFNILILSYRLGLKFCLHVHIHIMLKIQVGIDSENTCTFFFSKFIGSQNC